MKKQSKVPTGSDEKRQRKKQRFANRMAWAFREIRDNAARIAIGAEGNGLDFSPDGPLAKLVKQAGPVDPPPLLKRLDTNTVPDGIPESARVRLNNFLFEDMYDPLYPVPRREFAKAVATLEELVQMQGEREDLKGDSNIGQTVKEIAHWYDKQGMSIPKEHDELRRMVALWLAIRCHVCSAVAFQMNAEDTGLRLFITEHEAQMAQLRADEASSKARLYTVLGCPEAAQKAWELAESETGRTWQYAMIAADLKTGNDSARTGREPSGANFPDDNSVSDDDKLLSIKQQEAFAVWRKFLATNNVKLQPKMRMRFYHLKQQWAATEGHCTWGEIVKTITFQRFKTLWESYETGVRRGSKNHFPAP